MTVLIIDDSRFMRLMLKNILVRHGFEVIGEANDGGIGVEKYIELKPDIVTMDVTMKKMNGLDALKQIISHNSDARVLMVSSMGQEIIVRDAIIAGAKGFIVKPFDEALLISTFRKALS